MPFVEVPGLPKMPLKLHFSIPAPLADSARLDGRRAPIPAAGLRHIMNPLWGRRPDPRTEELQAPPGTVRTPGTGLEEADTAEGIELPGADLSGVELTVEIVPPQRDEFICSSCFLVHHRSQLARGQNGRKFCRECET